MFWQEPRRVILTIVSCQFLINVVAQNLDLPRLPPLAPSALPLAAEKLSEGGGGGGASG